MSTSVRFIALDIHKEYFVAGGVDPVQRVTLKPRRIANRDMREWVENHLTVEDRLVIEMTTNAYEVYDILKPHVHSVTVVHPPHVALITRAQVKTDRKAVETLAQLHAAGLLPGVWIPPKNIRDLRALVAQRRKMVRLTTTAKNRLHSALHRHHLAPPEGSEPFNPKHKEFWLNLPVSSLEQVNVQCDWETVEFAERQKAILEEGIRKAAADDERIPLLIQLPGLGMLSAITMIAAIGDITRFSSPKKLVGYAGMGARIHNSGTLYQTGRITKAGRKDIRHTMVEAAQRAVRCHPRWKAELARLEPRLGRSKAIVAIARKLLVVVWYVLTEETGDRYADEVQVAKYFYAHAFDVGVKNLPGGMGPLQFTRYHLDRLGIGTTMTHMPWSGKRYMLPPSTKAG